MTRALSRANWSGVPSLNRPWLVALLRAIAMLWSNVAATFRMLASLLAGDWRTGVEPRDLSAEAHDTIRETDPAANSSDTKEVSKEEGGLTGLRHIWKRTLGPRSPRRRGSSPLEKESARSAPNPLAAPGSPPQFIPAKVRTGTRGSRATQAHSLQPQRTRRQPCKHC